MQEFSVLIATVGEHLVKPLVWPLAFAYILTKVISFINEAQNSKSGN